MTDVSIKSLLRSVNSDRLVVPFRDGLLLFCLFRSTVYFGSGLAGEVYRVINWFWWGVFFVRSSGLCFLRGYGCFSAA